MSPERSVLLNWRLPDSIPADQRKSLGSLGAPGSGLPEPHGKGRLGGSVPSQMVTYPTLQGRGATIANGKTHEEYDLQMALQFPTSHLH